MQAVLSLQAKLSLLHDHSLYYAEIPKLHVCALEAECRLDAVSGKAAGTRSPIVPNQYDIFLHAFKARVLFCDRKIESPEKPVLAKDDQDVKNPSGH